MRTRRFIIFMGLAVALLAVPWGVDQATAQLQWTQPIPNPAIDYTKPNYAYSPILPKFVDQLVIPRIAWPTLRPDGSEYYDIGVRDYTWTFHRDLPATRFRGYYQAGDVNNMYLAPIIVAKRYDPTVAPGAGTNGRPVRVKFYNQLDPSNTALGRLFLPVDETVMGAGPYEGVLVNGTAVSGTFAQNRAAIHLHGGNTPWVSDGTPHQWITPRGDPTNYPKGLSFANVPDMPEGAVYNPKDGVGTYLYPNQQSSRLMFYHDHAFGITRLNVYAGEAAGYLLTDAVEQDLITRGILPDLGTPLIIQDKTFVNVNNPLPAGYPDLTYNTKFNTTVTDPNWDTTAWGGNGSLWFPHVYQPNQNPADGAMNPVGRWDYGPYMWPPISVTNPTLPTVSIVPEAFMDTPVVNGKAYPFMNVDKKA